MDVTPHVSVAVVHDYLTQRGGAERVVLSMLKAFPAAPLYTSLYNPHGTFPAFAEADLRTLWLDRVPFLRSSHRLALPVLSHAFAGLRVASAVVICSSSGWSHAARVDGRKVVYCHTPARWLYQTRRYLGRRGWLAPAFAPLRSYLARRDRAAAATADRYLANSSAVRDRIREEYGIEAEILPPPHTIDPSGEQREVGSLDPGFFLCVSRLLPYKNVRQIAQAFRSLPGQRLVVVGTGPEATRLREGAPSSVSFVRSVSDAELRWLYASSCGVVSASHEDFGLVPLEAAAFGKPAAVLRWGGFLETVLEDVTGVFFDRPSAPSICDALRRLVTGGFRAEALRAHAAKYSEERFVRRLREIAAEEAARGRR